MDESVKKIIDEINFILISIWARNLTIPLPSKPQLDGNLIYDNRKLPCSWSSKGGPIVKNKLTRRTSHMIISIAQKFDNVKDEIKKYYKETYGFFDVKFVEFTSSTMILFITSAFVNNYTQDLVDKMYGNDILTVDNMYKSFKNGEDFLIVESNYLKRVPPSIFHLDADGFPSAYCFRVKTTALYIKHDDPNYMNKLTEEEAKKAYISLCINPVFYEEEIKKHE